MIIPPVDVTTFFLMISGSHFHMGGDLQLSSFFFSPPPTACGYFWMFFVKMPLAG